MKTMKSGSNLRWVVIALAVLLTISWICLGIWYLSKSPHSITELKLNEIGDLIAGALTPLAVIWLIAGFFLQANELSLQVAELTQQVKATKQLAKTSEQSTRLRINEAQPMFKIYPLGGNDRTFPGGFRLYNFGETARDLKIGQTLKGISAKLAQEKPVFKSGEDVVIEISPAGEGWTEIRYVDRFKYPRFVWIEFNAPREVKLYDIDQIPEEIMELLKNQ